MKKILISTVIMTRKVSVLLCQKATKKELTQMVTNAN